MADFYSGISAFIAHFHLGGFSQNSVPLFFGGEGTPIKAMIFQRKLDIVELFGIDFLIGS